MFDSTSTTRLNTSSNGGLLLFKKGDKYVKDFTTGRSYRPRENEATLADSVPGDVYLARDVDKDGQIGPKDLQASKKEVEALVEKKGSVSGKALHDLGFRAYTVTNAEAKVGDEDGPPLPEDPSASQVYVQDGNIASPYGFWVQSKDTLAPA